MPERAVPQFSAPRRVRLASPRGYCAGVDRAVEIVEVALRVYGPPVYVRKQIVHNLHVVRHLEAKGAVFVNELDQVPRRAIVVLSAHGVTPQVHSAAAARELRVIDATCPLVTKVHNEARKFDAADLDIVLVGHAGHEEVEGTTGHARRVHLVQNEAEAAELALPDPDRVAYLTQTTLSVDETAGVIDLLRTRFPAIRGPRADDICYATQNRQHAAKALAAECELVLVIGAENSSNSKRLVEVVRAEGRSSHLIADATELDPSWFDDIDTVGVTSGASAPERLVTELVEALRARGATDVREVETVPEDVHFALPAGLRRELEAAVTR